jgi:hypothetical protein
VNCGEARLLIGAEPHASSPELEEHLQGCPACQRLREEMRALDANIRRALEQPPVAGARRISRPTAWRPFAMAASVLLALTAVLAVWVLRPSATLAHEVVAHVQAEPDSWLAKEHVSASDISEALKNAGVSLNVSSDRIMYAQSCWFRGHYVPHLVVETDKGPATVMLLRHEHVPMRRSFHEGGMSGVLVPLGKGSIAVLTRGDADAGAIAGQMQQEVHWLPQAS